MDFEHRPNRQSAFNTFFHVSIAFLWIGAVSAELIHPGITVTREELDTIKARVENGVQPQLQGYNKLLADSRSSLSYTPHPVASADVGYTNDAGYRAILNDATAANAQAYLWYITRNERYAQNVMAILQAHADNLQTITGHNTSIFSGWTGKGFAKAAEILKYTYDGWNEDIERDVIDLFDRVFLPHVNPSHPNWRDQNSARLYRNNWSTIMYDTYMCISIFKDDVAGFRDAANLMLNAIEWYLYPNGECVETGRDLQHVQMGISAIARAAETAWKQGIDLFSYLDNRLLAASEFQAKYVHMGGTPTCTDCNQYPALGTMDFTRTNKQLDPLGMPYEASRSAGWELIYNHYHNRMGLAAPRTRAMVEDIRSRNWVGWTGRIAGMGTLLHANMHACKPHAPFVRFHTPMRKPEEPHTFTWRQPSDTLTMKVNASAYLSQIASVAFYANGDLLGTATQAPYNYMCTGLPSGNYTLKAVVTDTAGKTQYDMSALKVSAAPANIILNAIYPNEAQITGSWIGVTRPDHLDHYGYNYLHDRNAGADPTKNVSFTPTIVIPGKYRVYLWWKYRSDAPVAAPLEIKHAGGIDNSKTVNQRQTTEWNYIDTYEFAKGSEAYIKISAADEGYTMANACKLVYVKDHKVVFAVNCGHDGAFTAHDGVVYAADARFTGGSTFYSPDPVQRTPDGELYQHFRYSASDISYNVPVDSGYYTVTLKFMENNWIRPGQRVWAVRAEGVTIADNLDIAQAMADEQISDYGLYKGKAYDFSFPVLVRDGELNLTVQSVTGRVVINGILVETLDDPPASSAGQGTSLSSPKGIRGYSEYRLRLFTVSGKQIAQIHGHRDDSFAQLPRPHTLAAGTYLYEISLRDRGRSHTLRGRVNTLASPQDRILVPLPR